MNSIGSESSWSQVRRKRLKAGAFTAALMIVWVVTVVVAVTTISRL
ncbi:hypothetical protein STRTUCAR8_03860 [Streptomyces turgidiscabies Car8]|uniref:Uncharacterized protein n=1 Tax=Streptomyces turgidiscabies (strain Car8) TaxID=698760 RepID=L7FDG8_STRT8|nr:hypothetical protein STRTUCAR8_03860 [Streptomyces turgidiscabies Car8]